MPNTLMDKMEQMQLPDNVYNWIKDFFDDHYHCTKYSGEVSTVAEVKASVIQVPGLARHRSPSQLLIYTLSVQRTVSSSLLTTLILRYPHRTLARDRKKSFISKSGRRTTT